MVNPIKFDRGEIDAIHYDVCLVITTNFYVKLRSKFSIKRTIRLNDWCNRFCSIRSNYLYYRSYYSKRSS